MCGIAGIVDFAPGAELAETVEQMTAAIAHRGPDGHGTLVRDGVALGHRRLSIIDLALGSQPMANEDDSVWVVYNGEIYNFRELKRELQGLGHRFRTDCDTEVVVHGYEEWGADSVRRFRGMFAFAAVDFRRRELLLARDHFGVKPLFYRVATGRLLFASELAAIRAADAAPPPGSLKAIDLFLRYSYIPAPDTIYRDVFKLPPAHTLVVRLDKDSVACPPEPTRYWRPCFQATNGRCEQDWLEEIDERLTAAVKSALVCDVPFGVFLSGGIDSTLVCLKMREVLGDGVKAFTIGFKEEDFSELRYAEEAARRIGVDLHAEIVEPDALAILPELVEHYGEPFGDSSAIPTWYVSKLARTHVPMVLSGDGGDESFGGYESYRAWMRTSMQERLGNFMSIPARATLWPLLRSLLPGTRFPKLEDWQRHLYYFDPTTREALWREDHRHVMAEGSEAFDRAGDDAPRRDRLAFAQHMDLQTYLPNDILTKVDVASMYHSLEVRPALLSVDLVESAMRLPPTMRMRANGHGERVGKVALKRLLGRTFPEEFIYRRKQGFSVPLVHWFLKGGAVRGALEQALLYEASPLCSLFRREVMQGMLCTHAMHYDHSPQLWTLLVLSQWIERNGEVRFA